VAFERDRTLDFARSVLTDLLLRGPRRLHEERWQTVAPTHDSLGLPVEESPVVGVATTDEAGGSVYLLLSREADFSLGALYTAVNIPPLPVRSLVTGRILPAARPAQGGDSISGDGPGGETGTLGCLVENTSHDRLVLGCNHTLAGINQATVNRDTVRHPGAGDGGAAGDTLGTLTTYVPIQLGGYHPNMVDAALAEPTDQIQVAAGVRTIGPIQGVGAPLSYGDRVQKVGWRSGVTAGTYRYKVSYAQEFPTVASSALFVDQYGIIGDGGAFAQQGDSGAVVLTEKDNQLVGMVIGVAEGMNMALISPIAPILNTLGVMPV
jgi:hypothetical protein